MNKWNGKNIIRSYFLMALIFLTIKVSSQESEVQPEIWLLSGNECNVCEIFDKTKEDRDYGQSISLQNVNFLIKEVDKDKVPDSYKRLVDEIAIGNEYWSVQLNIAVVKGDTLLYHGNIAESADWRNGVINEKYMRPPVTATLDELHSFGFNYGEFFRREFNLEHFAKRALNPSERSDFNVKLDNWVATDDSVKSKNTQVSILGTAKQPAANGLFISTRIRQLQALFSNENLLTIYANGQEKYRDTLVKTGDQYEFVSSDIDAQYPSTADGMNSWLQNVASSKHDKQLIIQVGHSGPTGTPIWGSALTVTPEALKAGFDKTNQHITLVSGSCHSGLFAKTAQCGYFAAHPGAISTGCQTSLEAIESSDDYVKYFFLEDNLDADANKDKQVSFHEAHWYSSSKLEKHNISYSDYDASVDEYFASHPADLPNTITLLDLAVVVKTRTVAEQLAYKKMSYGLANDTEINLTNHVALHNKAIETLKNHTEKTSEERNSLSRLAYPLNLVMLARRALYATNNGKAAPMVESCSRDSTINYL
jgi:hypothetical protein